MRMYHSLSRNQLQTLVKLKSKKHREKQGKFILEGLRACEQAIKNGQLEIESVLFDSSQFSPDNEPFIIPQEVQRLSVSKRDFKELSSTITNQGIAVVAKIPKSAKIENIINQPQGILIATDGISDPGNMGTIYRTAVWYGAKALLPGLYSVDLYNPKVTRSTAGVTGVLSIIEGDLLELLSTFQQAGWELLSLELNHQAEELAKVSINPRTILIVGNEANGVRKEISNLSKPVFIDGNVHLVESLNASVSCGIALHTIYNRLKTKS